MTPTLLYKYLSPSRVDVLQNLRIRFTQVSALNDPFESFPAVILGKREWYLKEFRAQAEEEMIARGIQGEAKKKQFWRERKKEFAGFYKRQTDRNYLMRLSDKVRHMSDSVQGCLSLSATSTNILMWSHYAEHHRGYVIGFFAEHEYFGRTVHPVTYSETRPSMNPFEERHSGDLFVTKSADWSYEQEYRKFQAFVQPITFPNGNDFLPHNPSDAPKSDNEAIMLFPFPREAIACVILGWKSSSHLQESIAREIERHQLPKVSLYKVRPSLSRYEMEASPL